MARYRMFRPGAGGYRDNTDTWAGGLNRLARVLTEPDGLTRLSTPRFRPYVYRGTGTDVLTAFMDDDGNERFGPGRPVSQPCGTPAAYRRHYRHGKKPCEACKQAERLRQTRRKDLP